MVLLVVAIAIGFLSLWYTNTMVEELAEQERKKIELWAKATKEVSSSSLGEDIDVTFYLDIIAANTTIPVILTDASGNVTTYRNLDTNVVITPAYLQKKIEAMKAVNDPIVVEYFETEKLYFYYENSHLLYQLRIYPWFQLGIIALFLLVSYFAFSYSRRSEQNKVWAGMSKETAHQLGTPISSLLAWVDYIEDAEGKVSDNVLLEIRQDLNRLSLITERFSKIGSDPVLNDLPILEVIEDSVKYLNVRVSEKVVFEVNTSLSTDTLAKLNEPLFAWVIENLCKNAVDAMKGEGKITFDVLEDQAKKKVLIDVTDTGSGIASKHHKTIFKPGFTSKKRGWGLGLSLVKRIVEDYHKGKIYVKHSEIGKGTTFRIELQAVS